ncbi:unnamed protein product, partial [Prorocentrum cordatum]
VRPARAPRRAPARPRAAARGGARGRAGPGRQAAGLPAGRRRGRGRAPPRSGAGSGAALAAGRGHERRHPGLLRQRRGLPGAGRARAGQGGPPRPGGRGEAAAGHAARRGEGPAAGCVGGGAGEAHPGARQRRGRPVQRVIIQLLGDAPATGCVVTLQGLSGTGKGTTVSRLKELLPNATTWSNGNLFRSLALLAGAYAEKHGVPLEKALEPDVMASLVEMLEFDDFGNGFDVKIDGLGMKYMVSDIEVPSARSCRCDRQESAWRVMYATLREQEGGGLLDNHRKSARQPWRHSIPLCAGGHDSGSSSPC